MSDLPETAALPPAVRRFMPDIDLQVLADDGMYEGDDVHYLSCGASALNAALSALQLAERPAPAAILDFGSGAGRVTRWLRAAFPEAEIHCCDLRPVDLDFCRDHFGARTWVSGTDIAALAAPRRYDFIWVGSVLTHLSEAKCRALLVKLLGWTEPGGIVAASLLGRTMKARQDPGGSAMDEPGWRRIRAAFDGDGFGYSDYSDAVGYGLSLSKPSWSAQLVQGLDGVRLVCLAERAWDDLHDILAVQNHPSVLGLPAADTSEVKSLRAEAALHKARVAALEGSTSWRITAPLRRVAGLLKVG